MFQKFRDRTNQQHIKRFRIDGHGRIFIRGLPQSEMPLHLRPLHRTPIFPPLKSILLQRQRYPRPRGIPQDSHQHRRHLHHISIPQHCPHIRRQVRTPQRHHSVHVCSFVASFIMTNHFCGLSFEFSADRFPCRPLSSSSLSTRTSRQHQPSRSAFRRPAPMQPSAVQSPSPYR